MIPISVIVGVAILAVTGLALSRRQPAHKSNPQNNWRNEDYLARENDGTWAEGSTSTRSSPGDSTGIGF